MGVLNITPDSFYDGGRYENCGDALKRASEIVAEGAQIVDIGAESTRPGSEGTSPHDQISRVVPVIRVIRQEFSAVPISIDTRSAEVASEAIEAGADIINDVSALRDDSTLAAVAAETNTPLILMHRKGSSKTMQSDQRNLEYRDVVSEIADFLSERVAYARSCGIPSSRLALDPGIGFGKTVEHNLQIINRIDQFVALGLPVLMGASRKSFLGAILNRPDPGDRLPGSLACAVTAVLGGAHIIRAHDVRETVDAIRIAYEINRTEF